MKKVNEKQEAEFYLLVKRMLIDTLCRTSSHVKSDKFILSYWQYPTSVHAGNSLQWPSTQTLLSPYFEFGNREYKYTDYSSLLSIQKDESKICINDIDGFSDCVEFLTNNPEVMDSIFYDNEKNDCSIAIVLLLGDILERYIHTNKLYNYIEDRFQEVFTTITNSYFLKTLEFDICIPILLLEFDDAFLKLSDDIYIVKMTDDFIRSKHFIGNYEAHFDRIILDCATHMIVLQGYTYDNSKYISLNHLRNRNVYPTKIIDTILASIRVVTRQQTGYAQIITYPKNNWSERYCKGDLLGLTGARAKAYPDSFHEHVWLKEHYSVSSEKGNKIIELTNSLLNNDHNALYLACNRLNRSALRNDEEDSILDAVIGLEVLLSDNDKGELTFKVSSRLATLSTLSKNINISPLEIQQSMVKIYRFRSNVIHARTKKENSYIIKVNESKEIEVIDLAIEYLCMAIDVIASNVSYLDPKKIDELMMKKLITAM